MIERLAFRAQVLINYVLFHDCWIGQAIVQEIVK